ncbi:MAG: M20/M25/M40 family metallo-hydrolase [Acidobacteria bacterium]|nr:M20/M25/M40 family metallo-hydrolase [Acidobacteriota bacterium]
MKIRRCLALTALALIATVAVSPVALAQSPERVDLGAMTRIRQEGLTNSKVMETIGMLTDVIGPRLTGSPSLKRANEWTRDQLTTWGMSNAHLEAWGPFGRGWSLEHCSVHMVVPQAAPLIAIPKAWSPGTNGVKRGKIVRVPKQPESEADLAALKGKLTGAIVMTGNERELKPLDKPLLSRYTGEELDELTAVEFGRSGRQFDFSSFAKRMAFSATWTKFLQDEGVVAVVEPSGWDRGVVRVSGTRAYRAGEPDGVPALVMSIEHFNRIARLIDRKIDVELELDIRATFHTADTMAYNTVAEIPGTDKKDEIVMCGAHLDSWHSGTGATDNAAGSAVMLEAMRILKATGLTPRRTIRIALWTGEEQGLLGSEAYVAKNFAEWPEPTDPAEIAKPRFMRKPTGPLQLKPDHGKLSAYFNVDNGTGRIRGIYAEGNTAIEPIFRAWIEPLQDLGVTTVTSRSTGSTDHDSFKEVGLPGFQFVQDEVEYSVSGANGLTHHSNMDVYDRAQREDLMQASVVVAAFLYNAAMRDEMLPRKPLPALKP